MRHYSGLTMTKVQQARKMENQAACQAPVARSVYQAVLTSGRPHQPGLEMLMDTKI